jgi:hypothetical protein
MTMRDSLGNELQVGDRLTCRCCGAVGVVLSADEMWPDARRFDYEGSQWVLTPPGPAPTAGEAAASTPPRSA